MAPSVTFTLIKEWLDVIVGIEVMKNKWLDTEGNSRLRSAVTSDFPGTRGGLAPTRSRKIRGNCTTSRKVDEEK